MLKEKPLPTVRMFIISKESRNSGHSAPPQVPTFSTDHSFLARPSH